MQHADEIRRAINHLKETDQDYQNAVYVGTNARNKVRGRITTVMNILSDIVSENGSIVRKRLFDPSVKKQLFHAGYICSYCGNTILSLEDCEVDRIIPFEQGGPTDIENAQLLHRHCNRSKGKRVEVEFEFIDDSDDDQDAISDDE